MVDIKSKRCECGKQPSFCFPGDRTRTCCSSCKKEGMVNIKTKRCACGTRPSYGFPGDRGKKIVKTSSRVMATARVRAGALPKEQRWCQSARRAMASLLSGYDSDPEAELAAEAREKRQDSAVESRHSKRLASGWRKCLAVMADFIAAGERLAMRREADSGSASSCCAAAAAARLGTAPPAAPPGVESRGFAFSSCAAAGSSGTPAPAAAASAAAGAPGGPWAPGPASQSRCTPQTLVDADTFAQAAARVMAAPESHLLMDALRAQHAGLRSKWCQAVASGGEERGFGPFLFTHLEIVKAGSPAEKLGMARALAQDWAKRQGVGNTRETRKVLRCLGATIWAGASLSET